MTAENRRLAKRVTALARPIWNECYSEILTQEQIDYMLDRFHGEDMIYDDLENGFVYEIITCDGKDVGYCGYAIDGDSVYLSKFYVMKEYRGRGLGRKHLANIEEYARRNGKKRIHLRVNKHNVNSVASYEAWGFRTYRDDITQIGGGFVMDDHLMEKIL